LVADAVLTISVFRCSRFLLTGGRTGIGSFVFHSDTPLKYPLAGCGGGGGDDVSADFMVTLMKLLDVVF
jgi:hypothetical protein